MKLPEPIMTEPHAPGVLQFKLLKATDMLVMLTFTVFFVVFEEVRVPPPVHSLNEEF